MAPIPVSKPKLKQLQNSLKILNQLVGAPNLSGIPKDQREAYLDIRQRGLAEAQRALTKFLTTGYGNVGKIQRKFAELGVTDPSKYMTYHHWSKGLEPGEEPHHGYGGLQRQIRMALLDHSKHYEVTQRLADIGMHLGQPGIEGVPANRWPLIHNLHVGTQGIEKGLGHRSESAHALSGRFAPIPINLDASSKEIAGQVVEQTAAEEAWNKSRGQLNTNLNRSLIGLTPDQRLKALEQLQTAEHQRSLELLTEWDKLNAIMTGTKLPELKPQEKVKLPDNSTQRSEKPIIKAKQQEKVSVNPQLPVTPRKRLDKPVMEAKPNHALQTLEQMQEQMMNRNPGEGFATLLKILGGASRWVFSDMLRGAMP